MIYMDNREFESPLCCGLAGQSRLMGSCDKATILAYNMGPIVGQRKTAKKLELCFKIIIYRKKKLLKYI